MNKKVNISLFAMLFVLITALKINAQEGLRPLGGNLSMIYKDLAQKQSNLKNQQNRVAAGSLQIPFKEDFSYAPTQSLPDPSLWRYLRTSDSSVYVNTGHAIAPPSIGVATFDGLNNHGYPYTPNTFNLNLCLTADTLTSTQINLLTSGGATLQPSDSVALTFYYQARGFGDAPEVSDSLVVDFYEPQAQKWNMVWWATGNNGPNTNDTIFKRGFIWIDTLVYLRDSFQFRFRNKATTIGDFDHWHVDYIYLDKNRSIIADTTYDDIAFGYVPRPFLRQYSSMPWEQYTANEKAAKNSVFIRNNGNDSLLNMTYENRMYDPQGNITYTYTGGANPGLKLFRHSGWSNFAPHSNPVFNYTFAPFTDSADFKIKHFIYRSGALADFYPENDTVIQYQKFRNYYAYDDESAEQGYYIMNTGSKLAQKYTLNVADTLRAIRIYFDPVGDLANASQNKFRINIWNTLQPGANPVYVDSVRHPVIYNSGFKSVPEFSLSNPLALPPGDYYIGFQQTLVNQNSLNGPSIGFDRNINHMDALYYDTGNGWTQSSYPGSVMMHPVFGRKIPPPVGIKENSMTAESGHFSVFPNPAADRLYVTNDNQKNFSYRLSDVMGQTVDENKSQSLQHTLNTSTLSNGIYFLILSSGNQIAQKQKIVIQH